MADHYKVLGITKNASKNEIKDAFRKLAVQFHPDKHSQSPKSTKDAATLKFKQVSEAYEVLTDDRKRAAYNSTNNTANYHNYSYGNQNYRRGGGGGGGGGGGSFYRPPPSSKGFVLNVEGVFRYMMTRGFLLNLSLAGMLLGGIAAIEMSRERLWKIQNAGKSFEEALESIEKNKARKDKQ